MASSLLVLSSVLKGSVGEAFLASLAITSKYQAPNKDVLAAYGKFFSLLLQAGSESWEEYLLDQASRMHAHPAHSSHSSICKFASLIEKSQA